MPTRLDLNYDRQILAVRTKVSNYAERLWNGLGSYRDADAERLIAALVPRVEAGQLRIAQLTDAYIARTAAATLGTQIRRGSVADVSTEALRGVPADEVYNRPFVTTHMKLSEGKSVSGAIAAGGARLESIVTTGMQLASTHAASHAMSRSGVESFARELTGRENCGLCVIASTQRYHRGNLLPIHPGCDCHVRVLKDGGTDQVIDPDLLERMHSAVEAKFGGTDRGARSLGFGTYNDFQQLLVTNTHGELGPVLGWRGQDFTSLSDIKRSN